MNPLHPVYEILAKEIVYAYTKPEFSTDVNNFLNTYNYQINNFGQNFADDTKDFQALGLTGSGKPPVLIFRGGDQAIDDPANGDSRGVGFNQFEANKDAIQAWITEATNQTGQKPIVIGHSLGGALAQITAAEFTNSIAEVITFNAPGTSQPIANQFRNKAGDKPTVTHYIVSGDIVSLGGAAFLPGTAILQSYTDPAINPIYALDKHRNIGKLLSQPPAGYSQQEISVEALNRSTFTFQNDSDYAEFITAYTAVAPQVAPLLLTRGTTEALRTSPGFSFLGLMLGARDALAPDKNNVLVGDNKNNTADGGTGNDTITGNGGNDTLKGGTGYDAIFGNLGNDELIGGADSDAIVGGVGNDLLIGIDPSAPGLREVDALTGGTGKDVYVLGNKATAFYDDGQNATLGWTDFALITDFKRNDDVIRLHGKANDYLLKLAPPQLAIGTAIYLKTEGKNELVGIVAGNTNLNLNSNAFAFIS